MDIRKLNERLEIVLNELNDTTIANAHGLRNLNFKRAEQDFYNGAANADLRMAKKKLDKNIALKDKRELRKNYEGRYLRVEYDDDQAVYDSFYQDQIEMGRTEEEIIEEDAKYYTIWVYGADKHPLEYLPDGSSFMFNYTGIWAMPGWNTPSDEEILEKAQEEWAKELIPDNIRIEWE